MKAPLKVRKILRESLQGKVIKKSYYRFISVEYMDRVLSSLGSLHGGRYNPSDAFETLYMAADPQTAIIETVKSHHFRFPPKIIITIDVNLQSILDIEDAYVIESLRSMIPTG